MKRFGISLGIAVVACLIAWILSTTSGLRAIENISFDWRCRLLASQNPPSEEIVVVSVTDESLDRMNHVGRWPWPRDLLAAVLDYCEGAKVIGFDFLFAEPSKDDDVLAAEMRQAGKVVNAIFLSNHNFEPPDSLVFGAVELPSIAVPPDEPSFPSAILPVDSILRESTGLGHVNYWPRSRSIMLTAPLDGRVVPSFALASFLAAEEVAYADVTTSNQWLVAGDSKVQVDDEKRMLLSWRGKPYRNVDVADIFASFQAETENRPNMVLVPRATFQDKIVLIGMEATGLLGDRKLTPVDPLMPGVMVHATAVDNLLNNQFLRQSSAGSRIGFLWLLGLLPALAFVGRPGQLIALTLTVGFLYIVGILFSLFSKSLMLPMAPPLLALFLSAGGVGLYLWWRELHQRRRLEQLDKTKQIFTDMLVHDLKNTVAPVLMSVDLAKEKPDGHFAQKDFPFYVEQTYNQLLLQVNSILDIRKMEEGRLQLKTSLVSPLELIYALKDEYEAALERMELYIDVEESEGAMLRLHLDGVVFRRVLENILWNALKYADRGTPIDVFCGLDGDQFEIRIANKCRPISPARLDKIFGAFVTGDEPQNYGNITSSGLGLAFCKLAVEGHGGTILVNSPVPGRKDGFQVRIALPNSMLENVFS